MVVSLPLSTRSTLSKTSLSTTLKVPVIFSILTTSPTETLYCLPPVCITANSAIIPLFYLYSIKYQAPGTDQSPGLVDLLSYRIRLIVKTKTVLDQTAETSKDPFFYYSTK